MALKRTNNTIHTIHNTRANSNTLHASEPMTLAESSGRTGRSIEKGCGQTTHPLTTYHQVQDFLKLDQNTNCYKMLLLARERERENRNIRKQRPGWMPPLNLRGRQWELLVGRRLLWDPAPSPDDAKITLATYSFTEIYLWFFQLCWLSFILLLLLLLSL